MDQRSQYLAQALQAMSPQNVNIQTPLAQPERALAPKKRTTGEKKGGLFGNIQQAGQNAMGAPGRAVSAVRGLPSVVFGPAGAGRAPATAPAAMPGAMPPTGQVGAAPMAKKDLAGLFSNLASQGGAGLGSLFALGRAMKR